MTATNFIIIIIITIIITIMASRPDDGTRPLKLCGFGQDCLREWGGEVVPVDFSLPCPITLVSLLLDILCCIKAAAKPRIYANKTASSLRIGPTRIQFWNVT